ncbi:MAG: DNA/RNA nuclease SfsA [Armatimonadota bacterium]
MRLDSLSEGVFLARPNRFGAWIRCGRRRHYVYVPNSGRLGELLTPGAEVRWRSEMWPDRKTCGDLLLVKKARRWVAVDARLPPRLLSEAVGERAGLAPFGLCRQPTFEPPLGNGRADLLLPCADGPPWLIETKCITLVVDGVARFPDAPTERGERHMLELAELAVHRSARSVRPAVAFVCQRSDVYSFRPHDSLDPAFGAALREAARAGVVVVAYRCRVGVGDIRILSPIGVDLSKEDP